MALAAGVLVAYLAARGELRALRRAPRGTFLLGLVNAAIPFTLIAVGEQYIDSGTAAIANAGVPLFVALLASWFGHVERVRGARLAGVLLGLAGVGWLVGFSHEITLPFIGGTAMMIGAAVSYAAGALYGQHLLSRTTGPVIATAAYIGASAVLLPLGAAQAPRAIPGATAVAALVVLALVGTAVAQLLWFEVLARFGSSRASLVTYLVPCFALAYGAVLGAEPIGLSKVGALALIVVGVVLASGRDWRRVVPPDGVAFARIPVNGGFAPGPATVAEVAPEAGRIHVDD